MRGVQFEDEAQLNDEVSYTSRRILGDYEKPGMIRVMKKMGLVKTERQGHYLLLFFVIIAFALSAVIIWYEFFRHPSRPVLNLGPVTPAEVQILNNMDPNILKEYPHTETH